MAGTRLDPDITKPSVTQPGDGAHDTTDRTEQASTLVPRPGPEALAVGTVNGVVPAPRLWPETEPRDESNDRFEIYLVWGPRGRMRMRRNVETGKTVEISEDEFLADRQARVRQAVVARQADADRDAAEADRAAREAATFANRARARADQLRSV